MSDKLPIANDITLLFTRLLVAAIFLWHGAPKALNPEFGIDKFEGYGLPGILGPFTGALEILAGVLLVAGLFTKQASGILAVIILGAVLTVQIPAGITAGLERDLLILIAISTVIVNGPGVYALDRLVSKRRSRFSTQ